MGRAWLTAVVVGLGVVLCLGVLGACTGGESPTRGPRVTEFTGTGVDEIDVAVRAWLDRDAEGVLGLVAYTTFECDSSDIGYDPTCEQLSLPPGGEYLGFPTGSCHIAALPQEEVPAAMEWELLRRDWVFHGAFVPAGNTALGVPADYVVLFFPLYVDYLSSFIALGLHEGHIVASWLGECSPVIPEDGSVERWIVHPRDLGFDPADIP